MEKLYMNSNEFKVDYANNRKSIKNGDDVIITRHKNADLAVIDIEKYKRFICSDVAKDKGDKTVVHFYKIPPRYWANDDVELRVELKGVKEFDANVSVRDLWHLCNWSCWTDEEPDEIKGVDFNVVCSDIIISKDNKFHISLPIGWEVCESYEETMEFLKIRNWRGSGH